MNTCESKFIIGASNKKYIARPGGYGIYFEWQFMFFSPSETPTRESNPRNNPEVSVVYSDSNQRASHKESQGKGYNTSETNRLYIENVILLSPNFQL